MTTIFALVIALVLSLSAVAIDRANKDKPPRALTAALFVVSLPAWLVFALSLCSSITSTAEIAITSPDTALQYQAAGAQIELRETRLDGLVKIAQSNNLNAEAGTFDAQADLYYAQADDVRVDTAIKSDDHTAEYAGKAMVFASHNLGTILLAALALIVFARFWHPAKEKQS